MPHATPEMIADPSLGACARMRDGCGELGPYRPFYKRYVCDECVQADAADLVDTGRFPWKEGPNLRGLPIS